MVAATTATAGLAAVVAPRNEISPKRQAELRTCCAVVEQALLQQLERNNNNSNNSNGSNSVPNNSAYQCDWETLTPQFVQHFQDLPSILGSYHDVGEDHDMAGATDREPEEGTLPSSSAKAITIDWNNIPPALQPDSVHCELDTARAHAKRIQLQALVPHVLAVVDALYAARQRETIHVVEFGAGSGHVGLLLAYLRPRQCRVTLVERKAYACTQARQRWQEVISTATKAPVADNHVAFRCAAVHEFVAQSQQSSSFDLAVALHGCGVLTDAVLTACVGQRAAFVLCPCCYGQIAVHLPAQYLPRSYSLLPPISNTTTATNCAPLGNEQQSRRRKTKKQQSQSPFVRVARAADCTTHTSNGSITSSTSTTASSEDDAASQYTANFILAKRCMQLVDADRLLWARQQYGYQVHMTSLRPLHVTPKNNIIVGMVRPTNKNSFDTTPSNTDDTALWTSAQENRQAEVGERRQSGMAHFGANATTATRSNREKRNGSTPPLVRCIGIPQHNDTVANTTTTTTTTTTETNGRLLLDQAFHITNAFDQQDLQLLDDLRHKIPLDTSRPTCPRRFLTEKPMEEDSSSRSGTVHREDGWVGKLLDRTVASWNLPFPQLPQYSDNNNDRLQLVSLPWYRFLEYAEPGGHMDRHTDGSNVHPVTGARSVATMLIYLSTCRTGGSTTLYRHKDKHAQKNKKSKSSSQPEEDTAIPTILESIQPVRNTALIFPHHWPHAGDPVEEDPKIALRVDLTWSDPRMRATTKEEEQ